MVGYGKQHGDVEQKKLQGVYILTCTPLGYSLFSHTRPLGEGDPASAPPSNFRTVDRSKRGKALESFQQGRLFERNIVAYVDDRSDQGQVKGQNCNFSADWYLTGVIYLGRIYRFQGQGAEHKTSCKLKVRVKVRSTNTIITLGIGYDI